MTTLIAIQHDDWCLIAGDSQTTSYHLSADCSPMGKIAQNGKYLVAAAGLVRGMNLIQHAFNPPPPPKSNLDKFMVNVFVPALRKCFQTAGYDMKDDGDIDDEIDQSPEARGPKINEFRVYREFDFSIVFGNPPISVTVLGNL